MAKIPEIETPVETVNMTGFKVAVAEVKVTGDDTTTIAKTSQVSGISLSIDHNVTTGAVSTESSVTLLLNNKLIVEPKKTANQDSFDYQLDEATAENIRSAVKAIHSSGGVSAHEAELADNLRQVITNRLLDDKKLGVQDVKDINEAAALLRVGANPAKETRSK